MAEHAHSTRTPRQSPQSVGGASRGRPPHHFAAAPRAQIERLIEDTIGALDALDAAQADMEPDHDGEAEPDEESAQPAALAPDRAPPKVVRFPRRPRAVQVTA